MKLYSVTCIDCGEERMAGKRGGMLPERCKECATRHHTIVISRAVNEYKNQKEGRRDN